MIPLGPAFSGPNEAVVTGTAIRHALPTIAAHRDLVIAGALLSLMPDEAEQRQIFAYFADKILRGAKPADLPIQQPTKFLLSVNLNTAKALGLTLRNRIAARQRADPMIGDEYGQETVTRTGRAPIAMIVDAARRVA